MNERERRLQILTNWFWEHLPKLIEDHKKQESRTNSMRLRWGLSEIVMDDKTRAERLKDRMIPADLAKSCRRIIQIEGQKRWATSRSTTNDYADVVLLTVWDEILQGLYGQR